MLDFRIRRPRSAVNWRYQEIIVTEEYISEHKSDLNLIELDSRYESGIKGLDVYLNGQRLTEGIQSDEGIGFEEIDDLHIRLNLGYDDGRLLELQIDDVIIIKEWFNSDSVLYSYHGINSRLIKVEHEIYEAKGNFPNLDARLNDIDSSILKALGEGNYTIEYIYADNGMDILKERAIGDCDYVKEYKYNDDGKPIEEIIYYGLTKTTRRFEYDIVTGRITKVVSYAVRI